MNPIQIVALCVRLFTVWIFWLGMNGMCRAYLMARMLNPEVGMAPYFCGAILLVPMCLLLWLFPKLVAKAVLPKTPEAEARQPVFDEWFGVGCSLIGLWVLSNAIPGFLGQMVGDAIARHAPGVGYSTMPTLPIYASIYAGQMIFGAWLFLGARGARRLLRWAREA